jgi:hypothetical protein
MEIDKFDLSNELVTLSTKPVVAGGKPSDIPIIIALVASCTLLVLIAKKFGSLVQLPKLAPVLLMTMAVTTGCDSRDLMISNKENATVHYTSTVVVKQTTPLREAFGASPDAKKAWFVKAEYPGGEGAMYQSLRQLNTLLSAKDMKTFATDEERAAFITRCYTVVGFTNVQLVDPDKK